MKKIEFSDDERKAIVDMYKNGMSAVKIGDIYGCSRKPIKRILHEYDIELDNVLRKIPKDEYQNVIDLYNSGKTQKEVAQIYGCDANIVGNIMKKLGVKVRPNGVTTEDAKKMYELYQSGKRLPEIAKTYGVDQHTVGRVFKRNGFETDRKTYHCNEHYFDKIDTYDKAYIIGLLWSDGHNDEKRGKITIQLQERDKTILEDVKDALQSDMPLWFLNLHDKNPNWSNTYTLTLRSKHMSEVLASYGMVQRKSLVLTFPKWLDKSLYPHFIRGYMDGDGSIYYSQQKNVFRASMIGTQSFMETIQNICLQIGVKSTLSHKNGENDIICSLSTTSNRGTLAFLDWIYKDANLKLQRKYDKYQQAAKRYNINNTLAS